jgi:hypothetical protein
MKWLPYRKFELTSPMRREDAVAAMTAHVEPVQWIRLSRPGGDNDQRFEGEMTPDGFDVRRVLGYRNSFAPTVRGEIHAAGSMTRVVVTMRPHLIVFGFIAIWCSFLLLPLTFGGVATLVSALMIALAYIGIMAGFWFEANSQERALREIFKAPAD